MVPVQFGENLEYFLEQVEHGIIFRVFHDFSDRSAGVVDHDQHFLRLGHPHDQGPDQLLVNHRVHTLIQSIVLLAAQIQYQYLVRLLSLLLILLLLVLFYQI